MTFRKKKDVSSRVSKKTSKDGNRSGSRKQNLSPATSTAPKISNRKVLIVGIGASAGGLEAFTRLLQNLPTDTGMAFVLVQHLDPAHPSALTQLLTKATFLPVHEITTDVRVKPNHVYVIAPNTSLEIAQGVLKLQPRRQVRGAQRSIDYFFESLAKDLGNCAIGVILSGTASDGTMGLEAIKGEGGITFAQDKSASFQSMPQSAIASGCVDFVLPPENIAQELARIATHPLVAKIAPSKSLADEAAETDVQWPGRVLVNEDCLKRILVLLRNHSLVDFSLYKVSTIQRRIIRRMVLNKLTTLDDYEKFLRGNAKELDALYADVLISVTSFFRNPECFEFLKRKVFPKLLAERRDSPLRIWVVGCATGQEVYSLAMAITECLDRFHRAPKLQIFASDLNEALLDKARAAIYAKSVVQDVSAQRLRRFFVEDQGSYRINKSLREAVVFARQNIMSDPPFSRMDIVSCRNLLIYLGSDVQKTIMPTFHYALKPKGCLFLGASETVGSFADLFAQVDKKHKIYFKKPGPSPALRLQAAPKQVEPEKHPVVAKSSANPGGPGVELNVQREADRLTRNHYAPPSVIVNAEWRILEFRGHTSSFLEPPVGQAHCNLLKMAREGLMLPLRTLLKKAKKTNRVVRRENVHVNADGEGQNVNIEVVPLKNLKEPHFLIFFEDTTRPEHLRIIQNAPAARQPVAQDSRRLRELTTELTETRDYLQSLEEKHESAVEEVQSANQETTSANEELQSINEELETSKEELESANEELTTVNEEMGNRNTDLNRLNSDLTNLQTSTNLAIVLLGPDLTIRRFSEQAEKLFNLLAADIGRPISSIRHNLVFPESNPKMVGTSRARQRTTELREKLSSAASPISGERENLGPLETLIHKVISGERDQECTVRDNDGRWYSLRVRPYINLDSKPDGAVLVLLNIDLLKKAERAISEAREYAEGIVETVREALLILDGEFRVKSANRSYYRAFQVEPSETVGKYIYELGNRQWDVPKLRELLEDVLPQNTRFEDFEVEHEFERIGRRTMLLNARRIHAAGGPPWILLAIEDVTDQLKREQELESAYIAEAVIHSARDPLVILNADLSIHSASEAFNKTFGLTPAQTEGRLFFELVGGRWDIPYLRQLLKQVVLRGTFFNNIEISLELEPRHHHAFLLSGRTLKEHTDKILLTIQDITEVLAFQTELRRTELRYRRLFEAAKDGVLLLDPETRKVLDANPFMTELLGYKRDELLGKELHEIGLFIDQEGGRAMLQELRQHAVLRFDDLAIHTKTNDPRAVEMVSNLYQENGDKIVQCNIRDITNRKHDEEELRRAQGQLADRAGDLERAVAERTKELIASNKQLEAFIYTVAHDLRAPLRSMQSFSALLVEEANATLNDTARDYANRVKRSAQFMDALLADLLSFSRLGQQPIELASVNLEAVFRSALSRLEKDVQEKSADVKALTPFPTALAFEPMLVQVLVNLLSNALKFVATGVPPVIRVRAEEHGSHVRVSVEDNGIGIAPDFQEQIFRPFMRLNGEKFGGTGIGLAIVQKAIERMGGSVGVASTAGQGSQFWFELQKA